MIYYINFKKTEDNGVEIPSRCKTMNREEATKRNVVLYDRGEIVVNARMLTDEVKYHKEQLQLLSDLKSFILIALEQVNPKEISSDWLSVTIDRCLHPEKFITINEEEQDETSFFELMELYLERKKFSLDHTKAFRVLIRDLARFEMFIRITDNLRKDFKLDIHTLSKKLVEEGHEVYVITYPHKEIKDIDGIHVIPLTENNYDEQVGEYINNSRKEFIQTQVINKISNANLKFLLHHLAEYHKPHIQPFSLILK